MEVLIKIGFYFLVVILFSIFLGRYIAKIFRGENTFLGKIVEPIEKWCHRFFKIDTEKEMKSKEYFVCVIGVTIVSFLILFFILVLDKYMPWAEGKKGMSVSLAFHTAISYITNTNFQNYAGEKVLSNLAQMIGLTVQNFISAGIGISVLFVLIRGLIQKEKETIGNFWRDLSKIIWELLLPLSIVTATILVFTGVPQTFQKEGIIVNERGEQKVPVGTVASQVAIKQLGSNGGGYYGENAASGLENPNEISNFVEMVGILLIPMSLVFMFGNVSTHKKQGYYLFGIMLVLLLIGSLVTIGIETQKGLREERIDTSLWSVLTTATSNGSVNSSLDNYHPASLIVFLTNMAIGEVIFGGVGSGLYTMIVFVFLTVFIAGLMIGKSPQYLGKKMEVKEMKMVLMVVLITPLMVLIGSSISMLWGGLQESFAHLGSIGFTEIFYNFLSSGANNGSSLKRVAMNGDFLNMVLGIVMLVARYLPIYGMIEMAGSLSKKKKLPESKGTLQTTSMLFSVLLVVVIFIVGGLSFLPSIALGPIAQIL